VSFGKTLKACLYDENNSGFYGGPAFIQQSEQHKKLSKSSYWLEKSQPFKKPLLF